MAQAYFGKPANTFVPGGAHVAVYLVPVFEGRLLVFDVAASAARGRWLPWDVLGFGANPYEAAADLADLWCGGAVTELAVDDAMSFPYGAGGWELSIVFRTELTTLPVGDDSRRPFLFEAGAFDAIGNFDPLDLERWVNRKAEGPSAVSPSNGPGLLF